MFSALSAALDFAVSKLLYKNEEEHKESDFSSINDLIFRDQDVLLSFIVDQQERNAEVRTSSFTGKVTQVSDGHGLIDGEIYFSSENINGSKAVQIGDTVNVVAKQQYRDGGWIAESVTVIDFLWTEEHEPALLIPSGEVGKVTQFEDGEGIINNNILFNVSTCQEGFRPVEGDWVRVELDIREVCNNADNIEDDGFGCEQKIHCIPAAKVYPLRHWSFEGVVSASMLDHGYINEEVYFQHDVCVNGYHPRKWDSVKVTAIESTQGKCNWRAVHINPMTSSALNIRNYHRQQMVGRGKGFLVAGQKPKIPNRKHKMSIPRKLSLYPVPENLRQCVLDQKELTLYAAHITEILEINHDILVKFLRKRGIYYSFPEVDDIAWVPQEDKLNIENYVQRMSTLLHLEEVQMELDIEEFNMQRVCLQRAGEFLSLYVPGLEEGRPSVLIGDAVILCSPVDPDEPRYEGIVHEIHSAEVLLKFNTEFHSQYNGEDYNVAFTFSRTPLKRCHQAVSLAVAYLGEQVLFPKEVQLKHSLVNLTIPTQKNPSERLKSRTLDSLNSAGGSGQLYIPNINHALQDAILFYNPHLNDQQKSAVIHILLGHARPMPYVIFGPPGTGKTVTVVEAILQVFTRIQGSRLIVCTPSNSAADLLAERLHNSKVIKMTDMIRLNAFSRSLDYIPNNILGYCSTGEKLDVLCRYRIIITTCNTAGLLYTANLKAGHFTHAFVDEAGQAVEPECLIPAGLVAGADGQIVLVGDPKQLGPILRSPFAKMYGLELSFLERLMDRQVYKYNKQLLQCGGFCSELVTMLVNNYRCHSSILQLPSELFYFGQLKDCAPHDLTHTLVSWHMLPRSGVPIIFHGERGEDAREGDSPSWFNTAEVMRVMTYLQNLLGNNPSLSHDSIGIITPYRKQVEKIIMMIDSLGIPKIKVGSVEEFQGQERQVIIISTVRSNEHLLLSDIRHVLGFLSNPKRFNVAVTRAQALLIVIGNPHVLVKDSIWQKFIEMCIETGSYTGCDLPESLVSFSRKCMRHTVK